MRLAARALNVERVGGGLDFSQPQFHPDYAGSAARFDLNYPVHNSMTETTGGGLSGNTMCHNSFSCRHSNDGVFYQTPSAGKAWLGV